MDDSPPAVRHLVLPLLLPFVAAAAYPQDQKQSGAKELQKTNRTIHVDVALAQTDVMVFDRQGRFVDNLTQDQFDLQVDKKPQPVSFFELVSTETSHDEEIWARSAGRPLSSGHRAAASGSDAGRMILMFVDDWHMSAETVMRARTAYLYNVGPKVQIQATIYRGNGMAVQLLPKSIEAGTGGPGTPAQVAFSDALPIADFIPGSFTLEVTATDRATNVTTIRRIGFVIDR